MLYCFKQLGAKKIGFGAQKVKADFTAIQKEAEMLDEMKEQQEAQAKIDASKREEDNERQVIARRDFTLKNNNLMAIMIGLLLLRKNKRYLPIFQKATMSLTYQEISKQQKKRVELLKADPKKAEQVERLGMGVGVRA